MSKSSTLIASPAAVRCPFCSEKCDAGKMLVHLATHHKGVLQIGEIYWFNKHEAFFNGRHYRRPR